MLRRIARLWKSEDTNVEYALVPHTEDSALHPLTSKCGFKTFLQGFIFAFSEFLEYILVAISEPVPLRF
jgi:hypothetical protein